MNTAPVDQSGLPRGADVNMFEDEQQGMGWLFFAGTLLGLAGIMRIVDSLWTFGYNGALPENLKDGVFGSNLTTYGWIWLGVGILRIVSSFLLLAWLQFAWWGRALRISDHGHQRYDVDALLPGLGAHVRPARRSGVLWPRRPRRSCTQLGPGSHVETVALTRG